jgi:cyclohexadienyl dehydratase
VEAVLAARKDPRLHAVAPDRPLTTEELSYMIPRDDPAFLNWINLWLHQMKASGKLERLRKRWTGR